MKRALPFVLCAALLCCGCVPTEHCTQGFAMDTVINISVYGDGQLPSEILREISTLDRLLSIGVEGGEVYTLNQSVGGTHTAPTVSKIIGAVAPVCEATDWRLSPYMRPLCELWSDARQSGRLPDESAIKRAAALSCDHSATLSDDSITLPIGVKIDLGAFGKGYACDRAAELCGDTPAVIAVGGSIALVGRIGRDWTVSIARPGDASQSAGTLKLGGGNFISTSGSRERYLTVNGQNYHHIIDPVTGYPVVTDIASVTVICNSGLLSDALSTAAFIMGAEQSLALLDEYGAEAVFIYDDGTVAATGGLDGKLTSTDGQVRWLR